MRILVFFDLPVMTKSQKKMYRHFRQFLLQDGYTMIQYSVYCRLCNGQDAVNKHIKRIQTALPPKGSIRLLQVTEKQYSKMKFLVGKPSRIEKKLRTRQVSLF